MANLLPLRDLDADYRELPPIWDHQAEDLFRLVNGSQALWWDPRMGKTRECGEALRLLDGMGQVDAVIVLGPVQAKEVWRHWLRVMLPTWEVVKLSGLNPKKIPGELAQLLLRPDATCLILNPDILAPQVRGGAGFEGWSRLLMQWMDGKRVVVILDEAHLFFGDPGSRRYKAVEKLCTLASRVWIATGTMYESSAMDIHHQLRLLGPDAYPFYWWKWDAFGHKFCVATKNKFKGPMRQGTRKDGTKYEYRQGGHDFSALLNEDELVAALQLCLVRRHREGELIPRLEHWVEGPGQPVDVMRSDLEAFRMQLVPAKVQHTIEYLEVMDVRPVVVFGWHRDYTQAIANHFRAPMIIGGAGEDYRERIRVEFQAGRIPIVVLNIRAAGFSSEWSAARATVFGELDWRATNHKQAEDRVAGPNQQVGTVHHYVLCSDGVDEEVWNKVLDKGRAMDALDRASARLRQLRPDLEELGE